MYQREYVYMRRILVSSQTDHYISSILYSFIKKIPFCKKMASDFFGYKSVFIYMHKTAPTWEH